MNLQVAIVTPVYRPILSAVEELRLNVSLKQNQDYAHFFVFPRGMDTIGIRSKFPKSHLLEVPSEFLQSKSSYNLLMLSGQFYSEFSQYCYLLVLQLDAFLIQSLQNLCKRNYDYVGSPFWPPLELTRGIFGSVRYPNSVSRVFGFRKILLEGFNGGLSLRKIETFKTILLEMQQSKHKGDYFAINERPYHEDEAFSLFFRSKGFHIPSTEEAMRTFHDSMPLNTVKVSEIFGFHALGRLNPGIEIDLLNSRS